MKAFFNWVKNKFYEIILVFVWTFIFICFVLVFGRTMEERGYKQGQLDCQRGIIEWKIEDGQVWHLDSKLE